HHGRAVWPPRQPIRLRFFWQPSRTRRPRIPFRNRNLLRWSAVDGRQRWLAATSCDSDPVLGRGTGGRGDRRRGGGAGGGGGGGGRQAPGGGCRAGAEDLVADDQPVGVTAAGPLEVGAQHAVVPGGPFQPGRPRRWRGDAEDGGGEAQGAAVGVEEVVPAEL